MDKVSVIIPYYNNEATIIRALDSVKAQTYTNLEIIIINDGSKDNGYYLVEEWIAINNIKTKHIVQNNMGPSKARNEGIKNSTGEYVAFLDGDDSWHPTKIEKQVKAFNLDKKLFILGTDHEVSYKGDKWSKSDNSSEFKEVTFSKRLIRNYFCTPSVMIRKEVFKKGNFFFEETQKYAEDTLMYLRILRNFKGGKICEPLVTLYKPEISKVGLSSNLFETEKYELLNYITLFKENKISNTKIHFLKLIFLCLFSLVKFVRRIIKVKR